jgi:hypothetical protein
VRVNRESVLLYYECRQLPIVAAKSKLVRGQLLFPYLESWSLGHALAHGTLGHMMEKYIIKSFPKHNYICQRGRIGLYKHSFSIMHAVFGATARGRGYILRQIP